MTKHLAIALGLVVISFLSLALGLSAAAGDDGAVAGDPGKNALGIQVVPAERALGPIAADLVVAEGEARNPFTMKSGAMRATRIPFPPPPPLDLPALPALPVLPIPER